MDIKVLGIGCQRCQELEKRVRDALVELNVAANVEHVKDLKLLASMGVFMTPGLVVDGKVVCQGRLPTKEELRSWLAQPPIVTVGPA